MSRALFFALGVSCLLYNWGTAHATEPTPASLMDSGFTEVVVSVASLERGSLPYLETGGWEVLHRGSIPASRLRFLSLPADSEGEEMLLRNPGTERGFIRLVRFETDIPTVQIRPSAQSWDSGGIFDFNVRVKDIETSFEHLRSLGWIGYSEPVEFSFGPFVVKEALARGPDGMVLAMIERVQPPLDGWPHLRRMSRVFNATQVVRDFDRSLRFFRDQLGFQVYLSHEGASPKPGPNVLGLPYNLTAEIPRQVVILSPDGKNDGSVELLAFKGASGADFSARAVAPNHGILSLRFPVLDLEAFQTALEKAGVEVLMGPVQLDLAPYGEVTALAIRAPEGARMEFYETRSAAVRANPSRR